VTRIYPIVEGHGEVGAVPALIRRVNQALPSPLWSLTVEAPLRRSADRLKAGELEKEVQLATKKLRGQLGGILVLLDCEDDCPATLGPQLLARARTVTHLPLGLALAYREFESWFMAVAETLIPGAQPFGQFEARRDAKGWLTQQMGQKYSEQVHQERFTAQMDLPLARARSDSLDKCAREIEFLIDALRSAAE